MRNKVYVVTSGAQWKVRCDHCSKEEITSTQAEAIRIAKRHVALRPAGTLSQIVVQGKDSLYRTEWTYGQDPFPPPG